MSTKWYLQNGTAGQTITTTNSGATQVTTTAGTAVYDQSAGNQFTTGALLTVTTSTGALLERFALAGTTSNKLAWNVVFSAGSGISTPQFIASPRTTGSMAKLYVSDTKYSIQDAASPNNITNFTTTDGGSTVFVPTPGTKYRLEMLLDNTAAVGSQSYWAHLYTPGGTTPVAYAKAVGTANLKDQTSFTAVDLGTPGGMAVGNTMTFAELGVNDGGTAEIGAYVPGANQKPTVTAGPTQGVLPGATVTLSFTASDVDGTIKSRATTFQSILPAGTTPPTISNGNTATPAFTAPNTPGKYWVQQIVTDDKDAQSDPAVTLVNVRQAGKTGQMIIDATTNWTPSGGAASNLAAVTDGNAATYAQSPDGTSTLTLTVVPLTSRAGASITIDTSSSIPSGTTIATGEKYTVALVDGTTTRASLDIVPTTTNAKATLTAGPTATNAIVDWDNLTVKHTHTAGA